MTAKSFPLEHRDALTLCERILLPSLKDGSLVGDESNLTA